MSARTEHDILIEIIDPANPTLTADAARGILQLDLPESLQTRLAELASKSREGELTPDETREFENHVSAGDLLSILKAKARLSLRAAGLEN